MKIRDPAVKIVCRPFLYTCESVCTAPSMQLQMQLNEPGTTTVIRDVDRVVGFIFRPDLPRTNCGIESASGAPSEHRHDDQSDGSSACLPPPVRHTVTKEVRYRRKSEARDHGNTCRYREKRNIRTYRRQGAAFHGLKL